MSTDHPNGGLFTQYPKILPLLMDRAERQRWIDAMPAEARNRCDLASLEREYTLSEVAIMTRAAPARLLGLTDRGHLAPGARADISVYDDLADRTAMFGAARLVLKDGRVAVRDGTCLGWMFGRTHVLNPGYDRLMGARMNSYYTDRFGVGAAAFAVQQAAFRERDVFRVEACRA